MYIIDVYNQLKNRVNTKEVICEKMLSEFLPFRNDRDLRKPSRLLDQTHTGSISNASTRFYADQANAISVHKPRVGSLSGQRPAVCHQASAVS